MIFIFILVENCLWFDAIHDFSVWLSTGSTPADRNPGFEAIRIDFFFKLKNSSYLTMMEGVDLLENPGPAVAGNLVDDLDGVLDLCVDVDTALDAGVSALAQNLAGQTVQLLKKRILNDQGKAFLKNQMYKIKKYQFWRIDKYLNWSHSLKNTFKDILI